MRTSTIQDMKHVILFAVAAALSLTACQKSAEEAEETAENTGAETTGLKIAYVEMDSLITQYQLYKDYEEELTRKGTNIQSTLAQKQRTLEQHAAAMQKKYESNGFTTRDELERAQNSIQAEQQQLQELADRLQTDFAQEQARVNQEARDSIQAFLKIHLPICNLRLRLFHRLLNTISLCNQFSQQIHSRPLILKLKRQLLLIQKS